jgi:hypothetical protein
MSKVAIVTYKVLDGKADENREFVQAVFSNLKAKSPAGVKYASTIADDNLTFTHIAYFESDAAKTALTDSAEFKSFQKDLKERCEIPPNVNFCNIVGTYNLF